MQFWSEFLCHFAIIWRTHFLGHFGIVVVTIFGVKAHFSLFQFLDSFSPILALISGIFQSKFTRKISPKFCQNIYLQNSVVVWLIFSSLLKSEFHNKSVFALLTHSSWLFWRAKVNFLSYCHNGLLFCSARCLCNPFLNPAQNLREISMLFKPNKFAKNELKIR